MYLKKLKPVDQNRCLLFDIAERMDLDDPPTTYANAAEPGTCDLDQPPSELQPQEASPKTMTRELFLNSFRPTETKMMRLMDQVGKGALDTEGYHKGRFSINVSPHYRVLTRSLCSVHSRTISSCRHFCFVTKFGLTIRLAICRCCVIAFANHPPR